MAMREYIMRSMLAAALALGGFLAVQADPPSNNVISPAAQIELAGPTLDVSGTTDGVSVLIRYTGPGSPGQTVIVGPFAPTNGAYSTSISGPSLGWGLLYVTTYNSLGEATTVQIPVNRVS